MMGLAEPVFLAPHPLIKPDEKRRKEGLQTDIRPRFFLAAGVVIPALSGLASQIARGDQFSKEQGGTPLRILEVIPEGLCHGKSDIKAYKISQLERPHGMAQAELQVLIDVLDVG